MTLSSEDSLVEAGGREGLAAWREVGAQGLRTGVVGVGYKEVLHSVPAFPELPMDNSRNVSVL